MRLRFLLIPLLTIWPVWAGSGKKIDYTASGVFSLISGADGLHLAGAKFTIQANIDSDAAPSSMTATSRTYSPITIAATAVGRIRLPINSKEASVTMSHSGSAPDMLTLTFPFDFALLHLTFNSVVSLPPGLLGARPVPYPVTNIDPSKSTFSYSNGSRTTVLGLSGTTVATAVD